MSETKLGKRRRYLESLNHVQLVEEVDRAPDSTEMSGTIIWGATGRSQEEIERCLSLVKIESANIQALLGWLVVSLSFADSSEIRQTFFEKVDRRIRELSPERAEALLEGLGPKGAIAARWGNAVLDGILKK